jgi:hypothetical protein
MAGRGFSGRDGLKKAGFCNKPSSQKRRREEEESDGSKDTPLAQRRRTQKDPHGFLALPDAMLHVIFEWLTPRNVTKTKQFKEILSFRKVSRRCNAWFERLPATTEVFHAFLNNDRAGFNKCMEECPFLHRVRKFIDTRSCLDLWRFRWFVQMCPNITCMEVELRQNVSDVLKIAPRLEELVLVNNENHIDSDDDDEEEEDDSHLTLGFELPELPGLRCIRFDNGVRPFEIPLRRIFESYPMLQELRIRDIDVQSASFPFHLPKHLKVLECPLCLFAVAEAQPGTVIERLCPTVDYHFESDLAAAREEASRYPRTRHASSEATPNITVHILEAAVDGIFGLGVQKALAETEATWNVLEIGGGNRNLWITLIALSDEDRRYFLKKFSSVYLECNYPSSKIAFEVAEYGCRCMDVARIWNSIHLEIHSRQSLGGPCVVTWNEKRQMLDLAWADRWCSRVGCRWC